MTIKSIKICKSTEEMASAFAKLIVSGIENLASGSFFCMALSGGSTPKAIFRHLAAGAGSEINWSRVKIFWGDERCVGPDDAESNYKMSKEGLLDAVPIPEDNFFRIMGENEPSAEARRYEDVIVNHVPDHQGIPRFHLVMLGLGDDGHTASIFPDQIRLFNSENLCVPAVNPYSGQHRISITGKLINHAQKTVILVTGASKAEKVAQVIQKREGWENLPASLVEPQDGELIWLMDEPAAGDLNR